MLQPKLSSRFPAAPRWQRTCRSLIVRGALTVVAMGLTMPSASAAVALVLDMDLTQPGIQQNRVADPLEMFDIGLVLSLTPTESVAEFSFDFGFDTDFVTVTGVMIPTRPGGFDQPATSPILFDNLNGTVGTFEGGPTFSSPLVAPPATDTTLGVISLSVMNFTGSPTSDTLLSFNNVVVNNSDLDPVTVDFATSPSTLQVTAVPEPTSLAVLGIAAAGAYRSRRRQAV